MPEDSIVNNNEAGRVIYIYIYIYNTHASKAKQIARVKGAVQIRFVSCGWKRKLGQRLQFSESLVKENYLLRIL